MLCIAFRNSKQLTLCLSSFGLEVVVEICLGDGAMQHKFKLMTCFSLDSSYSTKYLLFFTLPNVLVALS